MHRITAKRNSQNGLVCHVCHNEKYNREIWYRFGCHDVHEKCHQDILKTVCPVCWQMEHDPHRQAPNRR
ncbi:unnamed protein product, partial [Larinioides sclopetarius]